MKRLLLSLIILTVICGLTNFQPVTTNAKSGQFSQFSVSSSIDGAITSSDGWEWQNPLPQGSTLRGVWGSSSSEVFVVGHGGTILHYDGNSWIGMNSNTYENLYAVWGISSTVVFAVGTNGTILQYNGNIWSPMSSGTSQSLNGIWGTSDSNVFAVGNYGNILHYNGSIWNSMNSGTTEPLNSVWGTSDSDVFAIGGYGYNNGIILHYDGNSWVSTESGIQFWLDCIWGTSTSDIYAIGGQTLHNNGIDWNEMSSNTDYWLYGIWGSSESNIYAVGDGGTITHFDGSIWSEASNGTYPSLYSIWGSSSSDVFAVGESGTILHYNGSNWSNITSGTFENLRGIWGSSQSNVYAVGSGESIMHYDGDSWSQINSGTAEFLTCIWGFSDSDIFAVGENGTIFHYDGSSWSSMNGGTSELLCGVWGNSASDVYAVGYNDTILHWDGNNWSCTNSGLANHLFGIWGSSPSNIFAVGGNNDGTNGTILHYDGNYWSIMLSGLTWGLYGIWGTSPSDVFAVGYNSIILHFNGTSWSSVSCVPHNDLRAIWGNSSSNVFTVGNEGLMFHFDGSSWSRMNSGTANNLRGIWGSSPTDVFAVGDYGTILHYSSLDSNPPTVDDFNADKDTITLGESIRFDYSVSDTGGSGLKQVELWEATDTDGDGQPNWPEGNTDYVDKHDLSGDSASDYFDYTPESASAHWYGIHILDNAGNINYETNSETGGLPDVFGPIQINVSGHMFEYSLNGQKLVRLNGEIWNITQGQMRWQLYEVGPHTSSIERAVYIVDGFSCDFVDSTGMTHSLEVIHDGLPSPFCNFGGIPDIVQDSGLVCVYSNGFLEVNIWDISIDGCPVDQNDMLSGPTLGEPIWTGVFPEVDSFSVAASGAELNIFGFSGDYYLTGERTTSQPMCDFTAIQTEGQAPLVVQFADQSTGIIDSYLWDFGDEKTSTEQNPSHTYTAEGNYTVSLTVFGPGGTDTKIKEGFVFVGNSSPADLVITDVQAIFSEETISYNPLLPPDVVYVYYKIKYTADSEYWTKGNSIDSSIFSLTSNGQHIEIKNCKVHETSGKQNSYEATLQFEVPFYTNETDFCLSVNTFTSSTKVIAQKDPIEVKDKLITSIKTGVGATAGAEFEFALLGNQIKGEASAFSGGIFGEASSGCKSEISYSGVSPSEDYIVFGFPVKAKSGLEGSIATVGAEGNVLSMVAVDLALINALSLSGSGYGSFIIYPVRLNLEEDTDLISAFIIPIAANAATGSTALFLKIAEMTNSFIPEEWNLDEPYKSIDQYGFSFTADAGGSLDISLGVAGKTEIGNFEVEFLEASGKIDTFWEDGQEPGNAIHTHTLSGEFDAAVLKFENIDALAFGGRGILFHKTGQVGDNEWIIEVGGEPDNVVLEDGELFIDQFIVNWDTYSKLYNENGRFTLKNLSPLYEANTIRRVTLYQPKPNTYNMDIFKVGLSEGAKGEVTIAAELEHKLNIPVETAYLSYGIEYPVSLVNPTSIQSNYETLNEYAADSLEVFENSLKENTEKVKVWLEKTICGWITPIITSVISIGPMQNETTAAIIGTGENVARINSYGEYYNWDISVWEGQLNPPSAINNANLDFASRVILLEQTLDQPVPNGTTVTIYPRSSIPLDELSDVGVYLLINGSWNCIPSIQNSDGSYTFILREEGFYALIHSFPNDSNFMEKSVINMNTYSSTILTSDVIRNPDGSMAIGTLFNIDLLASATLSGNGTSIEFGESPIIFPGSMVTDGSGRLFIPIESGALEGEAYLRIRSNSGKTEQIVRVIVSNGNGIDDNFSIEIKMVQPNAGMAIVNQIVNLQAITSYTSSSISWMVLDQFGNEKRQIGASITFNPSHSGIYRIYCLGQDENGFAHLAFAEIPVTDSANDTDADGISDDLETYYGSNPMVQDADNFFTSLNGNQHPLANAGGPYEGIIGSSIQFSALASYDPDGSIVLFEWDFNNDGLFDFSSTKPVATHVFQKVFSGIVSLRVTDNDGSVNVDTSTINISAPQPLSVGGEVTLISKLGFLASWLILIFVMGVGVGLLVLSLRK